MSLTSFPLLPYPFLVLHADWSANSAKRWMGRATLRPDGRFYAEQPQRDEITHLRPFYPASSTWWKD